MRLTLELVFVCASRKHALSLEAALSPDNKAIPKDQSFTSQVKGRELRFLIASPRPSSCVSSALGLLSDASLFQDIWLLTA